MNSFTMDIDQQIKNFEEKIARLEASKRQSGKEPGRIEQHLDKMYEQISLLKIRKMMGF